MARQAFIVGCSQYDSPTIASLKYAASDAHRFASCLIDSAGFLPREICLLADSSTQQETPTRKNILKAITTKRNTTGALDFLIFFFSGHGFHSETRSKDFIIPCDAVQEALEDTSLEFETILEYLRKLLPRRIILFTDACRAIVEGGRTTAITLQPIRVQALMGTGVAAFASCQPGQRSYEDSELGGGLFTCCLAEALSSTGKCGTVYELDKYLRDRLPRLCQKRNKPVQNPFTRVEPLEIQDTVLVSQSKLHEWKGRVLIGSEIRAEKSVIKSFASLKDSKKIICGLDFGTTYSTIGILSEIDRATLIPAPNGKCLVPSVVTFLPGLDYVVGWDAVEYGKIHPENSVFAAKRYLGTNRVFNVMGRSINAEIIASLIIGHLKANAEEQLASPVDQVLVAVPANFSITRAHALIRACELAQLKVIRLIAEPCAASMHIIDILRAHNRPSGQAVVVDLGGGTFDVAVIETGEGVIDALSVAGDNDLGGLDFDESVLQFVRDKLSQCDPNLVNLTPGDLFQLRQECERAKIALGSRDETTILLRNIEMPTTGMIDYEFLLTRQDFVSATKNLNDRIENIVRFALEKVRYQPIEELCSVILAGQGCKIFTVRALLEKIFPGVHIEERYQESAVGSGISRYTSVLRGSDGSLLLLDANYTTIGVRCAGILSESHLGRPIEAVFRSRFRTDIDIPIISISPLRLENTVNFTMLSHNATIPARRICVAEIKSEVSCKIPIIVTEQGNYGDKQIETVGIFELNVGANERLEVVCDCDASRTLVFVVKVQSLKRAHIFQLNNPYYAITAGSVFFQEELEGWEISPIERLFDQKIQITSEMA